MKNQELVFNFQSNDVMFEVIDGDIWVNATQMTKVYDRRIDHFLRADHTEKYIEALIQSLNARIENFEQKNSEKSPILPPNGGRIGDFSEKIYEKNSILTSASKSMVIKNRSRSGIWFHQLLALKLASWLNPHFEVWVYSTISNILNKDFSNLKVVQDTSIEIKRELAGFEKRKEVLINKLESNRYYIELKDIESSIAELKSKLKNLHNNALEIVFKEKDLFTLELN